MVVVTLACLVLTLLMPLFVSASISLSEGGMILYPGWKLHSPKLLLLVADLRAHPESYTLDKYTLTGRGVQVWTASGVAFYRDWGDYPLKVGPLTLADRYLLRRALREFGGTSDLQFELALRRKNGMLGRGE